MVTQNFLVSAVTRLANFALTAPKMNVGVLINLMMAYARLLSHLCINRKTALSWLRLADSSLDA